MADALLRRLRAALIAAGDPAVAAGKSAYFKDVARMHGVKSPRVDALFAEHVRSSLPTGGRDLVLELSGALLRSEWHEEKHAGVLVLHSQRRELLSTAADALGIVAHVGLALDDGGGANDWATCDDLCGRVLRPAIEAHADAVAPVLHAWAAAQGTWRRRASAVAFVCVLRRGDRLRVGDGVLAAAAVALQSGERFVQLGVGWALRELAASGAPGREDDVAAFLVRHAALVSREGLRYATEKMPPMLRTRLLTESGKRPPAAAAVSASGSAALERGQRQKRGRGE
jgi:3-methyladenine DNA glycosylase AlkD